MNRSTRPYVLTALSLIVVAAVFLASYAGLFSSSAPPAEPFPAAQSTPTAEATPGAPVGDPTGISVPAIGVDEALASVGLDAEGAMEMPAFGEAAWYDPGPRPGDPGAAVVVAHVHGPDGPDLFWDLATLEPGDEVTVEHTAGTASWVVVEVEDVPKEQLPYERIWPDTAEPLLRLVTCGGALASDGSGYPDNTIVYARPA